MGIVSLAEMLEKEVRVTSEEISPEEWAELEKEFPFLRRKAE